MYKVAVSKMQLDGKIPQGSELWKSFNASFENLELPASDLAWAIQDGRSFTTWHRNHWRKGENYELGQHLGLDFDAGDTSSSIPALAADKFVQRYAAFIYSTPSSTPETPKSRVVFVLDKPIFQARNYVLAVRALLWLYGGTADEKCKDPCRFFYGRRHAEIAFVSKVLTLDKVRELIGQYQATGDQAKRQHEGTPRRQYNGDHQNLVRYWQERIETSTAGVNRNDTLNKAAYSLGEKVRQGEMRRHEVYDALEPAAQRVGLGKAEIAATIASGLRAWGQ